MAGVAANLLVGEGRRPKIGRLRRQLCRDTGPRLPGGIPLASLAGALPPARPMSRRGFIDLGGHAREQGRSFGTARDRRNDPKRVGLPHLRRVSTQVTNVLVVLVDVDKRTQPALF